MTAIVRVRRKKAFWRDRLRSWTVLVDGEKVAAVRNGRTVEVPVAPGDHSLSLTIDWSGSPELTFTASDGETAAFRAQPNRAALPSPRQLGFLGFRRTINNLFDETGWIDLTPC